MLEKKSTRINRKDHFMFSVIIPMYNASDSIEKTIYSVLNQTIDNFEIIIIDDGSRDDSKDIVTRIDDSRIKYIFQENSGVAVARNTGIKHASGEFICFLDADDLWKQNHLETVTRLIQDYPECEVYLTGYEIHLHDGSIIVKRYSNDKKSIKCENMFRAILERGYFICTNSIVCKASVFDSVGLFEIGIKNGEDDDLWYRIFLHHLVAISSEITSVYVRVNSRATISRTFIEDWCFLNRVDDIMASTEILEDRKEYLRRLLELRKLSSVRNKLFVGKKKEGFKQFIKLDCTLLPLKKLIETIIAFVIPHSILQTIINYRDRDYYKE